MSRVAPINTFEALILYRNQLNATLKYLVNVYQSMMYIYNGEEEPVSGKCEGSMNTPVHQ